jgi:hypothetical protein
MADDSTFLSKPRDTFDIAKLQDPGIFEEFLDQPLTFIAETITGALAVGKTGVMVAGGRVVQALLKGMLFKQWASEFKKLRETGRIPDDFAEKPYGFQTWVELMTIIDEEATDADRLEALKAMFFAVNKVGVKDGERIAAYQLWQLTKNLTSGEVMLLKVAFENRTKVFPKGSLGTTYSDWAEQVSNAAGHGIKGLIDIHEKRLTELGLFTFRPLTTLDTVNPENARLSNLGLRLCSNIENYQIEMREMESAVITSDDRANDIPGTEV